MKKLIACLAMILITSGTFAAQVEFVAHNPARIVKGELVAGDEKSVVVKEKESLVQVKFSDVHKKYKADLLADVLALKDKNDNYLEELESNISHQRALVILNHYHALYLANPCWQTHHDYIFVYNRILVLFPVGHVHYTFFHAHHRHFTVIVKRTFVRPVNAIVRSVIRHERREDRRDRREDRREDRRDRVEDRREDRKDIRHDRQNKREVRRDRSIKRTPVRGRR